MPRKLIAEITLRDRFSSSIGKVEKKLTHFTKKVGRLYREMISLKGIMYAMGGYTILRVGKGFTDAATQMELFGNQLLMISRSAKEAEETLGYLREFARVSPLGTKDVIAAYIRMRAVGINPTIETLKVMGGTALLMGKTLLEVTNAMISKHKRTAREYGIILDQMGKKAILTSGTIFTEVEKRDMIVRKAMVDVWARRFPNAIDIAAKTAMAKVELLMSNVVEFQAAVGELLMKDYKNFLVMAAIFFEKLRDHAGKVAASIKFLIFMFELVYKAIKNSIKVIIVFWQTMGDLSKAVLWEFDAVFMGIIKTAGALPAALKKAWKGDMIGAAKTLLDAFDDRWEESMEKSARDFEIAIARVVKADKEILEDWQIILRHAREIKTLWGVKPEKLGGKLPEGLEEFPDPFAGKPTPAQIAAAAAAEKKAFADMMKNRIASLEIAKGEMGIIERMITLRERKEKQEKDALEAQKNRRKEIENTVQTIELFASSIDNLGTSFRGYSQAKRSAKLDESKAEIDSMKVSEKVKDKLRKKAEAQYRADARKEKVISAGLVMMNTAVAIMRTYAAPRPVSFIAKSVIAGMILAAGALQLATIRKTKLASGNMYTSSGPTILGERGPEAAFMPSGSRVYNATQTKYNYSSPQISLNVNVSGNADAGTVNAIKDTLTDFAGKLTDAVRYGYINKDQLGIV